MIFNVHIKPNPSQKVNGDPEIVALKRKILKLQCIIKELKKKNAACGWISVNDLKRRPPEDEELLLFCQGGAYNQLSWRDFGYYSSGEYYTIFTRLDGDNDRVTHWMKIKPWPEE